MIEVRDDAGRAVVLARAARRIVSLVPSLTETLFALGCGERLVGVTRYCSEPADQVEGIERVGGTKNAAIERIVALAPDLVVLNEEENRRVDFEALEGRGLCIFVSFTHRASEVPGLLRRLGLLTGCGGTAEGLAAATERALADLARPAAAPRPRVFCPIWKNPWMSFNRDTYNDDMLWRAGGENVCRDLPKRYPTVTLAQIAAREPEIILLPDEPYVFQAKDLAALQALRDTPALRTGRVQFLDGKVLSWYGPRTATALRQLRGVIGGLGTAAPAG